jgi:hypothetical protein
MERRMPVYQRLAQLVQQNENCNRSPVNVEWRDKSQQSIDDIINNLPHGSGIDGTTQFMYGRSTANRLVIASEYHVMNENGMYDGWINFTITITPSLTQDITLRIDGNFGKNQGLKDYLYETFGPALREEMTV